MSSTNRGNARDKDDWYITPKPHIEKFLNYFNDNIYRLENINEFFDPCAGGSITKEYDMPYPTVIKKFTQKPILTIDIREDSKADVIENFLDCDIELDKDSMIVSNPPFCLAKEFIEKAYRLNPRFIVYFLRLNFLGSKERFLFFKHYKPSFCVVHHDRPSFVVDDIKYFDKKGNEKILKKYSTDSIEYAHFVWDTTKEPKFTQMDII
jgi:hypothetical protein